MQESQRHTDLTQKATVREVLISFPDPTVKLKFIPFLNREGLGTNFRQYISIDNMVNFISKNYMGSGV